MLIQQSEMNIQLYLDLPDLSALYKKCGIAIGAPGTSLLERMYCGMLNMTLIVAQNQRQVGRNMDALGAAVCLGDIQDFDADLLVRQLTQMIESSAFRKKLQEKARGLVDGKGAVRVVKHTIDLISSITLRKVKKSDLDILYHWQYEKGARRFFRVPTPPTKAEHQAWFDNMLSCNDAEMFIIEWCDMPAGYVRLNNKGEKKEISVLVVQNFQGFGFAKASLLKILKVKKQTYSAVIHPENKASIGLFTSLGFKSAGKGEYTLTSGYDLNGIT